MLLVVCVFVSVIISKKNSKNSSLRNPKSGKYYIILYLSLEFFITYLFSLLFFYTSFELNTYIFYLIKSNKDHFKRYNIYDIITYFSCLFNFLIRKKNSNLNLKPTDEKCYIYYYYH